MWLARAIGVLTMVAGSGSTWLALQWMNQPPPPPGARSKGAVVFDIPPPPPPPKRERAKPRPRPRPQRANAPSAPVLASVGGGLALGLGGFGAGELGVSDALVGEATDVVMTAEAVDSLPVPRRQDAPDYPPRARAKAITGFVTVELVIGADGRVSRVEVLESSPSGTFDSAALAAVRGWTFDPALYQGRPVALERSVTLRFELDA